MYLSFSEKNVILKFNYRETTCKVTCVVIKNDGEKYITIIQKKCV